MTDYLNEFTPDWPHGHVLVYADGTAKPFVVKVTDAPGEFPIWGHPVSETRALEKAYKAFRVGARQEGEML